MQKPLTSEEVIHAYVKLRDKLEARIKEHKDELAPMREKLSKMETWLQTQLQSQGLTSFKGASGMAFVQTVANVKVEDWDAMLEFIKDKGKWELLDRRVAKSVVLDYLDTFGSLPPGVEVQRAQVVRVHRG